MQHQNQGLEKAAAWFRLSESCQRVRALIFKCAWVIPIKLKPSPGFSNSILSLSGYWAFFDLFEHLCFQKENLKKARGLLVYASSRVSYNCFYCKPLFWTWAFDPEPIYWTRAFQPEHKPAQALAQWNHEGTVDDFSHSPIFFVDLKVRRRFSDPTWFSWWVSASSSSWGQSFKQKFLCGCSTVVKRTPVIKRSTVQVLPSDWPFSLPWRGSFTYCRPCIIDGVF